MEGRKLLLCVEEAVEGRIHETYPVLALRLQVLVDERGTTCPQWRTGAGTSYADPAGTRTPCISHSTIYRIAGRRVGISGDIRYLAKAVAVLIMNARAFLPIGLLKGVAETATTASAFGTALGVVRV